MKWLSVMSLLLAVLVAPVVAQAQIRTGGEPQRVPAEPQRVPAEPQRVPTEPQRVSDAEPPVSADPVDQVILAVPSESALAAAMREAFEDAAALAEDLTLIVGPIGERELKYYTITLKSARIVDASPYMPSGDVPMEEFVIAYEGFDLEPIADRGILDWHEDMIVVGKNAVLVEPDLDALFGTPAPANVTQVMPALPDLRIRTAEVDPSTPQEVKVRVVNTGAAGSAATRVRVWVIPQGKAWYGIVPALAAGQDAWVTVHADMPVMTAEHVYARADDPHKVEESDEGNNGHVLK